MERIVVFAILIIPVLAFSADYFDDFESYTVGDNLEDSPYWDISPDGGYFEVIDDGGDQVVESDFDGYQQIGYVCLGAAVPLDVAVDFEFEFETFDGLTGALVRVDYNTQEAYLGGIYLINEYLAGVGIYYHDSTGDTELVSDFLVPGINQNVWTNIKFVVIGTNPVELELFINGSSVVTHSDTTYLLGAGFVGFGCTYSSAEPTFRVDDFNVDDAPFIPIQSSSLGAIKTLFE